MHPALTEGAALRLKLAQGFHLALVPVVVKILQRGDRGCSSAAEKGRGQGAGGAKSGEQAGVGQRIQQAREPAGAEPQVLLIADAAVHHVLRIEVAARAILQAARVDQREVAVRVEFVQWRGSGVQPPVVARVCLLHRDAGVFAFLYQPEVGPARRAIIRIIYWRQHSEAIATAAQKNRDEQVPPCGSRAVGGKAQSLNPGAAIGEARRTQRAAQKGPARERGESRVHWVRGVRGLGASLALLLGRSTNSWCERVASVYGAAIPAAQTAHAGWKPAPH